MAEYPKLRKDSGVGVWKGKLRDTLPWMSIEFNSKARKAAEQEDEYRLDWELSKRDRDRMEVYKEMVMRKNMGKSSKRKGCE